MGNNKLKLTKAFFAFAILSTLPAHAYADENISVEYEYSGDLITMIDPTYWNYDYNTVNISTKNTNIRLTKEEFEKILSTEESDITINDGGSIVTYNKQELISEAEVAENMYNKDGEIMKKVILNGGVTLIIVMSTGLCLYNEAKTNKLK